MTKTKKTRNYNLEEQTYQFIKVFFYNCFGYSIIACLFGRQEVCSLFDIWSLGFVILSGGETNPEFSREIGFLKLLIIWRNINAEKGTFNF